MPTYRFYFMCHVRPAKLTCPRRRADDAGYVSAPRRARRSRGRDGRRQRAPLVRLNARSRVTAEGGAKITRHPVAHANEGRLRPSRRGHRAVPGLPAEPALARPAPPRGDRQGLGGAQQIAKHGLDLRAPHGFERLNSSLPKRAASAARRRR
jgi:hypothetical protein